MTTYGSVCSGIEAASVAWHPLGWRAEWLAEIEPFPSAALAHHYPQTPNLGDMTKIASMVAAGAVAAPDVLAGGTPCQAFSVAGLRGGLSDERGALTLSFVELANAIDRQRSGNECVIVWENVPGVLSSKDNAFGCFLAGLAGEDDPLEPPGGRWSDAGCVYGPQRSIAWRVLDAQYFGLAQRRRRVFVVASARDGFDPAAVLFEFDGVRRDSAPSREAGEESTACPTLRAGGSSTGGDRPPGTDVDTADSLQVVAFHPTQDQISSTDGSTHALGCGSSGGQASVAVAFAIQAGALRTNPASGPDGIGVQADHAYTLEARAEVQAVAVGIDTVGTLDARTNGGGFPGTDGATAGHVVPGGIGVRRLTPRECERLMGFPDGYTLIPWRKKAADDCPDGPRYKALGNSMAVPCMRWIGERIKQHIGSTP